jgi:putative membrane protein
LGKIWQPLVFLGCWSAAIFILHHQWPHSVTGHAPGPLTLLGIALSIFFSFRNNACYERWWEGRCEWGRLVSATRNFTRQTLALETAAPGERKTLLSLVIVFCHALLTQLRPSAPFDAAKDWVLPADRERIENAFNRPAATLQIIGQRLAALRDEGHISDIMFQLLDHGVQQFVAVQGACERIRSSPVPFSYSQLLRRTTFIFLFVLPFGMIDNLGWTSVLAELLLGYVFLGLDALGDELEEPFGDQPNALPIAALTKNIEIELSAALGKTNLPPRPAAIDFILL